MASAPDPITDLSGRRIGTVRAVHIGRNRRTFWEARSMDGCDLGAHPTRIGAEEAIIDDWDAGRPRDPYNPRDRWRPIYSRGDEPLYLGN
jgi:hypothetical protein